MKRKHRIEITKPDAMEISLTMDKSHSRRELFAIAESIGASKKGDKWVTAKNIGKRLVELGATVTITYQLP